MTTTVRAVREGDRDAVLALAPLLTIGVAPWRDPAAVSAAVAGWLDASVSAAGAGAHAGFVAEQDHQVIGFVSVGERTHFSGAVDAYVGELVVAPEHAGSGVGRALAARAEQWARDRGLVRIGLDTGVANGPARAFYAALGYLEEDVRLSRDLDTPHPSRPG